MNKGTQASRNAAERAWSLLEDFSPYTMKGWQPERVESAMMGYRRQAYDMVSLGSKDNSVQMCAHCVGVMLYCQFRGWGCAKEDFSSGGEANALLLKTGLAAKQGSKIASLVAGLVYQDRGDHMVAIYHFEICRGVPMANVMRGDSHLALEQWKEGYEAYQCAAHQKHFLGINCVGAMLKKGWGCKLDVSKGNRLEQEALKLGYWKVVEAYYEGIGNRRKEAQSFSSYRNMRSGTSQNGSAQPRPSQAVPVLSPSPLSTTQLADPPYSTEPWQSPKSTYGTFKKKETVRYRDAVCDALRLRWVPMPGDGDSFFASVSTAMACMRKPMAVSPRVLRTELCAWLGEEYNECRAGGVRVKGYHWLHAVATLYKICVVLVVHSDTDHMVFGDTTHQRIHVYKKDALSHYDALIAKSTGHHDSGSASKRTRNGGAQQGKDGGDKSQSQVEKKAHAAVPSSTVGDGSSRGEPFVSLLSLDSLATVGAAILGTKYMPSQPPPVISPTAPPGFYAMRTGPKCMPLIKSATPRPSTSSAAGQAAVAAGRSNGKPQIQGGNVGRQSSGSGKVSKATVVPRSDMPKKKGMKGVVKKGQTGGSGGVMHHPTTSVQSSNPIPPKVSSSASRHKTCVHGTRRTRCPLCNGNSLCPHRKQKLHCRECRKSGQYASCKSFCEHGRQRSRCKDCGGSGICQHGRDKYRCSQCRI